MRPSAEAVPDESTVKLLSLAAVGIPLAGLAASALSRSWSWFYVSGTAGVVLFAGTAFASAARHQRILQARARAWRHPTVRLDAKRHRAHDARRR